MNNIKIKKKIQNLTKRIDNFKIGITLWHGDGIFHENEEGNQYDVIFNEISLFGEENEVIGDCSIYSTNSIIENEENLKALRKEQKKLHSYLIKHFNNIEINEFNV